jgi:hypothetical protein
MSPSRRPEGTAGTVVDGLLTWARSDDAWRLHDRQELNPTTTTHNAVKDLNASNVAYEVRGATDQWRASSVALPRDPGVLKPDSVK